MDPRSRHSSILHVSWEIHPNRFQQIHSYRSIDGIRTTEHIWAKEKLRNRQAKFLYWLPRIAQGNTSLLSFVPWEKRSDTTRWKFTPYIRNWLTSSSKHSCDIHVTLFLARDHHHFVLRHSFWGSDDPSWTASTRCVPAVCYASSNSNRFRFPPRFSPPHEFHRTEKRVAHSCPSHHPPPVQLKVFSTLHVPVAAEMFQRLSHSELITSVEYQQTVQKRR